MAETTNKKKRSLLPLLLVALVIIAYGAFAYWQHFWPFSLIQRSNTVSLGSQFIIINRSIFPEVRQLDLCGSWPIAQVPLSAERGNPFARKISESSVITTTTVPQCQSVGQ